MKSSRTTQSPSHFTEDDLTPRMSTNGVTKQRVTFTRFGYTDVKEFTDAGLCELWVKFIEGMGYETKTETI